MVCARGSTSQRVVDKGGTSSSGGGVRPLRRSSTCVCVCVCVCVRVYICVKCALL